MAVDLDDIPDGTQHLPTSQGGGLPPER